MHVFYPAPLNIIEDFFNWFSELLSGIVNFIENGVNTMIGFFNFSLAFSTFFTEVFGYLPAFAVVILSTTIIILIVKFVLGR